jgi:hypothetical protein
MAPGSDCSPRSKPTPTLPEISTGLPTPWTRPSCASTSAPPGSDWKRRRRHEPADHCLGRSRGGLTTKIYLGAESGCTHPRRDPALGQAMIRETLPRPLGPLRVASMDTVGGGRCPRNGHESKPHQDVLMFRTCWRRAPRRSSRRILQAIVGGHCRAISEPSHALAERCHIGTATIAATQASRQVRLRPRSVMSHSNHLNVTVRDESLALATSDDYAVTPDGLVRSGMAVWR